MKNFLLPIFAITICNTFAIAQNPNVTWGQEINIEKGITDIAVVNVDNSGVYLKESKQNDGGGFFSRPSLNQVAAVTKYDNNLEKVYTNNFSKDLKGKDYEAMMFVKDKFYLLATRYEKKSKTFSLFAASVNKEDGKIEEEWIEVTNWTKDDKKEEIDFKVDYNDDSSGIIVVSSILGREKNNYQINNYDFNFKPIGNVVNVSNDFEAKTFQLEDVICTKQGNIFIVGKQYEFREGKRKKSKFLDFLNYSIQVFDKTGKLLKNINTNIDGKWLLSTKVKQIKNTNEVVLASFFGSNKVSKSVTGLLVQRINAATGDIITTNSKEISTSLVTENTIEDSEDEEETKEEKNERKEQEKDAKDKENENGFSKYLRINNVIATSDKGFVIVAEEYETYVITRVKTNSGSMTVDYARYYELRNLLISKVEANGNVGWIKTLPKTQYERFRVYSTETDETILGQFSYFKNNTNWPFYSGVISFNTNTGIKIVFNDHKANSNVTQQGQRKRSVYAFGRSDCYYLNINSTTGNLTRNILFSNTDTPTAMPRLSKVLNKTLYIVGKNKDIFLKKTKMAVAKITF